MGPKLKYISTCMFWKLSAVKYCIKFSNNVVIITKQIIHKGLYISAKKIRWLMYKGREHKRPVVLS